MQQHLDVKVEKTEIAESLEKELGISWDLSQGFNEDAGFDLRASILKTWQIRPGYRKTIPIGLHFQLPSSRWEIQIRPRSGLALNHGITILNAPGTIDYNYREEVMIILYNSGRYIFEIYPGNRIAQACFREVPTVEFEYNKIERTVRGGFGSTGIQ